MFETDSDSFASPESSESGRTRILTELARLANRNIETQISFLDAINQKSQQTLNVALAVLAGASAVLQFFIEKLPGGTVYPLLVVVVGSWVVGAFALFNVVTAYLGSKKFIMNFQVSWDFEKLIEVADSGEYDLDDVLRANIHGAKAWFERNQGTVSEARRRRTSGLYFLAGSGTLLALGYIYAAIVLAG